MTTPRTTLGKLGETVAQFTLDDVRRMMLSAAGIDDGVDLDGDIGEVDFLDLGYDSLALLELCSRVEREFATKIPDDAVQEMPTPNAAVAYVNARLAGQA